MNKPGTSVHEQKMCLVKECSDSEGFYFPVVLYRADEGESISQNELLLLSKEKVLGFQLSIWFL